MKPKAVPAKLLLNPVHLLAFGFGSGLSPKMPGTMGTVMGVLLYLLYPAQLDWRIYGIILLVAIIAGVFICHLSANAMDVHDHPSIVWDEIVGFWITMFMVPKTWEWIVVGFLLFRFFDILKPWPISALDSKVKGGLGIMLDDIVAAIFFLVDNSIFRLFVIKLKRYLK